MIFVGSRLIQDLPVSERKYRREPREAQENSNFLRVRPGCESAIFLRDFAEFCEP
jgi:hypothetical protein